MQTSGHQAPWASPLRARHDPASTSRACQQGKKLVAKDVDRPAPRPPAGVGIREGMGADHLSVRDHWDHLILITGITVICITGIT